MKFSDLKSKYSDYDSAKSNENYIVIGSFLVGSDGTISLSRSGTDVDGSCINIYCNIAKNRTLEQMDKFIESIL